VFAINIAGEEVGSVQSFVPRPLAWFLTISSVLLLIWMNLSVFGMQVYVQEALELEFKTVLWEDRVLDVLLQIVIIFAGVLGVLGLLAETHPTTAEEGSR
jgi:hypothetical protein